MKVIIGLGNPGDKYKNTRHSVGYRVIEELHKKNIRFTLLRNTDVFMNDSGNFVAKVVDKYNLDLHGLYIVHDDLDLRLGEYKIQFGKGPKVHNGLRDIYEKIGTKDFWHVRIGVDGRELENRTKGEEYVLSDFLPEEEKVVSMVIGDICKKLETL